MDLSRVRYLVVEGPIGVGKTSLARQIAHHLEGDLLLEAPEDNPFLPQFYRDMARYALPTQLNFLFQRVDQIRPLLQPDMFRRATVAELVRAASLQAKPEQIKAQVEELAASYEKPDEVVRYYYADNRRLADVEAMVIENNVTEHVLGQAKVTEKALGFDELMGQQG